MPRPKKAGLEFYYKGVHEWDDFAVMELMNEFGPTGYLVYEVVLSRIYENGYYLEIPLQMLAGYVMRMVGNKWLSDKDTVLKIIAGCGELGLFDQALLEQSVLTSREIQQHYSIVTARSKADKSRYWLLPETKKEARQARSQASAAETDSGEEGVFAAKTPENAANMQQRKANKSKQNKTKSNKSKADKSKAGGTQPAEENAAAPAGSPEEEIEEAFAAVAGRGFKPSDREALDEMLAAGADSEVILQAIRSVAKRGNGRIASMRYFIPMVTQAVSESPGCVRTYAKGQNAQRGMMPETSRTEDVEALLDSEWLREMSKYASSPEGGYPPYDDALPFDDWTRDCDTA